MGTPTLTRPTKVGGVTTYVDEYAYLNQNAPVLAAEVDADIQMIVDAWNNPASTFPPAAFTANDNNKLLYVQQTSPGVARLQWTNYPQLNNINVAGAVALGPHGVTLGADNISPGMGMSFIDAGTGVGFSWNSSQELMALTGSTRNVASLQLRPTRSAGSGVEALEINGALIVATSSAATPKAGTIQFSGGHFQGYNGTAWMQLD